MQTETTALSKQWRAIRALQYEHRFLPSAHDMDMRRTMIVGVDDDAQSVGSTHGRHAAMLAKPKR